MAIVAGIDEAGLGPVLGPLVVSSAAFVVPDAKAEASMWQLLAGAVCRKGGKRLRGPRRIVSRRGAPSRIAIADSKDLYSGLRGPTGLGRLERGVLAMLAMGGSVPQSLRELLELICPSAVSQASTYPWYGSLQLPLPRTQSVVEMTLAANALDLSLQRAGVRLLAIRSETVFEREFNRLTQASGKGGMLFDVTCRLLVRLWQATPKGRIIIYVDRQGGRMRYLELLARVFEGCAFKIMEENDTLSSYRLTAPGRCAEIHFVTDCENRQLPVALASMTSKYLRELFMQIYNSYWTRQVPGLAPTAGYYADGRRFFRDIQPAARKMGIDQQVLYRFR